MRIEEGVHFLESFFPRQTFTIEAFSVLGRRFPRQALAWLVIDVGDSQCSVLLCLSWWRLHLFIVDFNLLLSPWLDSGLLIVVSSLVCSSFGGFLLLFEELVCFVGSYYFLH